MGRKKGSPFQGVDCENVYNDTDSFSAVYHSQITSPAFMALSDEAKVMLMICKDTRRFYMRRYGGTFPDAIRDDPLCFYMNRGLLRAYGRNNPNKNQRALQELVRYGFIRVVELGWNTRTKNIYRYSQRWKKLKEGETVKLEGKDLAFCTPRPKRADS